MKVAIVTSHPVQYQAPLYRALAQRGIALTVMFGARWGAQAMREPGFGVKLRWDRPLLDGYDHRFLRNWGLGISALGGSRLNAFAPFNPGIVPQLLRGGFDVVLVHGWSSLTNWLAMLTALAARIPLVLRGETWQSERESRWRRALLNTLFRRVAAFAAVGSRNAGFYLDAGVPADRIFIAPYSVDSGFFASAAKTTLATRHERRRCAGIEPEELVVLFSGKLVARKNPLIIVDAIARCECKTRMVMLAVGDGELRGWLMQAADRLGVRLRIAGFKNQSELPAMYALADVIVLPSPVEPWGLVINEAMYFGLPAIVTDAVGAAADLVEDGITGFVVGSGDAEQLAARLDLLATNPELVRRMGQAARNTIASWGIHEAAAGIERACRYACSRRAADGEECAA